MTQILVVGPHPDDQEIGMGGTIAKLARAGHDVLLLDVTNGEPTPLGDPETRASEAAEAAKILGVKRRLLGFPNRYLENNLELRHALAGAIRAHRAEVLFTPFFEDAHPDHIAVAHATIAARFAAKLSKVDEPWAKEGPPIYPRRLFFYYAMHLRKVANPSFAVDIGGFEQVKHASIAAYRTQFVLPAHNRDVLAGVDASVVYFGSRIGTQAAEPFYCQELLRVEDVARDV